MKYSGIECDGTGGFKGEIRHTDSVPPEYKLDFVEILIKVCLPCCRITIFQEEINIK